MLLAKKLLMGDVNPYMFIYPVISSSGRQIAFSDYYITKDGNTLTKCTFPTAAIWVNPVYGHKKYITFATSSSGSTVYSSPDGKNWTSLTTISGVSSARLLFNGEYFYAFTTSGGPIYKSSNGSTWSSVGTAPALSGTFSGHTSGIAYRNGTFVVGCWNSTNYRADIWYSTNDCASWTQVTIPNYNPTSRRTALRGLAAGNDGFVILFSDTTSNAINLFYSSNGATWSKSTLTFTTGMTEPVSDGKNVYVSLSGSSPATVGYKTSGNGTWNSITLYGQPSDNITAGINKKFFCAGSCASSSSTFTIYRYNLADGSTGSRTQTLVVPTSSYIYYYVFADTAY